MNSPIKYEKLSYHLLGSARGPMEIPEYVEEQSQIRKNKTNEKVGEKT